MSIEFTTVRAAIHAWVVAATGVAADRVRWAGQNAPRADRPYLALRFLAITPVGQDWHTTEDASPSVPGAELVMRARGVRRFTLRVQAFGDAVGTNAPEDLLSNVIAARYLPTRADALRAGGVSVTQFGAVTVIDGLHNGIFEPRATLDVRGLLSSEVVETATFIETVDITDEERGETFTVDSTP